MSKSKSSQRQKPADRRERKRITPVMTPNPLPPCPTPLNVEKRDWVYVQRPREYEIPFHGCGHSDPDWSEYKEHLWCPQCHVDFVPKHWGILDGPVLVDTCYLMGIRFDRINLKTGKLELFSGHREIRAKETMAKQGWNSGESAVGDAKAPHPEGLLALVGHAQTVPSGLANSQFCLPKTMLKEYRPFADWQGPKIICEMKWA